MKYKLKIVWNKKKAKYKSFFEALYIMRTMMVFIMSYKLFNNRLIERKEQKKWQMYDNIPDQWY